MPPRGLPAGARGLRQPAAVPERRQAAAGLRLHPAGEEGHLHRRQAQVPAVFRKTQLAAKVDVSEGFPVSKTIGFSK